VVLEKNARTARREIPLLTDDEKKILRDSWRLVTPISETAAELFYKKLFELQPAYRSMFPEDMTAQRRKLMVALTFIVKASDWAQDSWAEDVPQEDDLMLVVLALGRRHTLLYKVPEEGYKHVGESLMWALNMGLGQAFTPEVKAAWAKIFALVSNIMKIGGRQALAAPA
jgi:hemoglobin-like flavoprotein